MEKIYFWFHLKKILNKKFEWKIHNIVKFRFWHIELAKAIIHEIFHIFHIYKIYFIINLISFILLIEVKHVIEYLEGQNWIRHIYYYDATAFMD